MVGVACSVRPITPRVTVTPPSVNRLMPVAGSSVRPSSVRTVLAARKPNRAPMKGWLIWQGWRAVNFSQPPCCRRSSSRQPRSNSWLPTALKSICMALTASMVGSSRNSDDSSGDAPTMSPAETTAWCGPRALSAAMALAK